jgi:hypothetical protein
MGRIDDVEEFRRFDVRLVSAPADAHRRASPRGPCRRAVRSCAIYVGHGLTLLGEHFSAGAWVARSEAEASLDPGR